MYFESPPYCVNTKIMTVLWKIVVPKAEITPSRKYGAFCSPGAAHLISPDLHLMKLRVTDFVTGDPSFQGARLVIRAGICSLPKPTRTWRARHRCLRPMPPRAGNARCQPPGRAGIPQHPMEGEMRETTCWRMWCCCYICPLSMWAGRSSTADVRRGRALRCFPYHSEKVCMRIFFCCCCLFVSLKTHPWQTAA